MGILQWAAALDTAGTFVRAARKMSKGAMDSLAADQPGTPSRGALEATLAGVVVSALKEAFNRDSARLDFGSSSIRSMTASAFDRASLAVDRRPARRLASKRSGSSYDANRSWT